MKRIKSHIILAIGTTLFLGFIPSLINPLPKDIQLPRGDSRHNILPLKYIYLTFDDGPLNGSENIDSVILAERLKISVFLVGEHAQKSKLLGNYCKLYEQD